MAKKRELNLRSIALKKKLGPIGYAALTAVLILFLILGLALSFYANPPTTVEAPAIDSTRIENRLGAAQPPE